jgi:predicted NACHT family NTPase
MNCCICGPVKNCGPYLTKIFENIEKISGLLTKKDESFYIFAHLSFQEYLASVQIQESNQVTD